MTAFDTGWVRPTSAANVAGTGTVAWTNASNILADDGAFATAAVPFGSFTNWLRGDAFGFSIPGSATIVGIEFRASIVGTIGSGLVLPNVGKSGAALATEKGASAVGTSEAFYTWGGASDLWGLSWSPAEINASTFLAHLRAASSVSTPTLSVDVFEVKVHYTVPPANVTFFVID